MPDLISLQIDEFDSSAKADLPYSRDWFSRPPPKQLKAETAARNSLIFVYHKSEGSCTGFGHAAVINHLNQAAGGVSSLDHVNSMKWLANFMNSQVKSIPALMLLRNFELNKFNRIIIELVIGWIVKKTINS